MSEAWRLALACGAGTLLGGVFFGGLWWTVRACARSSRPALLFLGSFVLRAGVVMSGIYVVADGDWRRMLACLLGFSIARWAVLSLTRPRGPHRAVATTEARHAP